MVSLVLLLVFIYFFVCFCFLGIVRGMYWVISSASAFRGDWGYLGVCIGF